MSCRRVVGVERAEARRGRARPRRRARGWPPRGCGRGRRAGSGCGRSRSRRGRCPTAGACATPAGGSGRRPTTVPSGRPSARPVAHVVEQEVGVGADHLVGRGRRCRDRPVCSSATWQAAQPSSSKVAWPARGVGVADVAPGRHGEGARVEGDLVELAVVDLGVAAVGRAEALGLEPGAGLLGCSEEVMPMSPTNAPAFCSSTVGTAAFQPKRPSDLVAVGAAGSGTRLARPGDAVAVVVVGIGEGEDVVGRARLEQPDAEHGGAIRGEMRSVVEGLAVRRRGLVVRARRGV